GAFGDQFGSAVSIFGDTALIGATGGDGSQGAAYVFLRTGTSWTEQQKLVVRDATANSSFGHSVAVSADTAIVGEEDASWEKGAAYVFVRSGATWTQQQKLVAGDGTARWFGSSVSLSDETVAVGAKLETKGSNQSVAAYVFKRSGSVWVPQQ